MVIIEEQDYGLVITNQDTGKRAVLPKSEQARWCYNTATVLLVDGFAQSSRPTSGARELAHTNAPNLEVKDENSTS